MKNKKLLLLALIGVLAVFGCARSPLITSVKAERTRINMTDIRKGMAKCDITSIMGKPYKVERRSNEYKLYEVWFYITKGPLLGQTRYVNENFTPFIFFEGYLKGWGWNFYNYLFDIDNAREKINSELKDPYTDDEDEWPANRHQSVPEESQKSIEDTLQEFLKDSSDSQKKNSSSPFTEIDVTEPSTEEPAEEPSQTNDNQNTPVENPGSEKKQNSTLDSSSDENECPKSSKKPEEDQSKSYNWW